MENYLYTKTDGTKTNAHSAYSYTNNGTITVKLPTPYSVAPVFVSCFGTDRFEESIVLVGGSGIAYLEPIRVIGNTATFSKSNPSDTECTLTCNMPNKTLILMSAFSYN